MTSDAGRKSWAGIVISVLPTPLFFVSAFFKFRGGPQVSEGFAHLGLPETLMLPLACLELACVVVYLIPRTAVLGAILLTGYLGGAICTHMRVGDPFYLHILMGILLWLGVYLREPRLKVLLPLRKA